MTKTAPLAPKPKRSKQVPLSFSKTEEFLLTLLDQNLKSTIYSSRSSWIKQKILEEFYEEINLHRRYDVQNVGIHC